jgi:flagellin
MSLVINHNISALNTQRNLEGSSRSLAKSLQKLSSGYKINVASDDPSGLIISEQLRAQTTGLKRAIRNSQEASNLIGITEGALIEMNEILKKLRGLAIHAANNGITSPEQVRADQAEVDSSIQTLDRIATTTKYSNQFLLNGSKGIVFQRNTVVDDTMDMEMLDIAATRLDQIFKREDVNMTINFNGQDNVNSRPDTTQEAMRAYLEADNNNADADINGDTLAARQRFVLTGNNGSRVFNFGEGTKLGSIVNAIDNVRDSTGVGAQLTFSSAVTPSEMVQNFNVSRTTGDVEVYNADINDPVAANRKVAAVDLSTNPNINERLTAGLNTDGQGRMWVKVTNVNAAPGNETVSAEIYKDRDMSMLVGTYTQTGPSAGAPTQSFTAAEGSNLQDDDILININEQAAAVDDSYTVAYAGLEIDDAGNDYMNTANFNLTGLDLTGGESVITGVDLQRNTDMNGHLYFKAEGAGNNRTISVYNDAGMAEDDLVARGTADLNAGDAIRVEEVRMQETDEMSGLNMTFVRSGPAYPAGAMGEEIGSLQFDDQGMRLYSMDYGSQEYIRLQNKEGQIWAQYRAPDDAGQTLVDVGSTQQVTGQNATISVNGSPLSTDGLEANVTTPDYSGKLVFNEGTLGEARIAQTGYDVGGIFSRSTSIQAVSDPATTQLSNTFTYATNARHVTTEILGEFIGGMQFQLSETEGDQSRTVYGIPSMSVTNLGNVSDEGESFSLQDVLGGGSASLDTDPVMALRVVSGAIDDVASLRARLGAFQKNMLQTNINSLNVAVENITKTESAIRDANMANQSSEFTKNQILVQAGTSMLAQANTVSQNVLQLLG